MQLLGGSRFAFLAEWSYEMVHIYIKQRTCVHPTEMASTSKPLYARTPLLRVGAETIPAHVLQYKWELRCVCAKYIACLETDVHARSASYQGRGSDTHTHVHFLAQAILSYLRLHLFRLLPFAQRLAIKYEAGSPKLWVWTFVDELIYASMRM